MKKRLIASVAGVVAVSAALAAYYRSARKAASLHPIDALRYE